MASSRKPRRADLDLVAHVRAALAARVVHGARLVVGFSGGVDSSVLLHVLAGLRAELGFQLSAVHVNHGLSTNAERWQTFCAQVSHALDVPFESAPVRVAPAGRGVEAAARVARHAVFAAQAADFVVLGHHQDDQVETFFLRLLRGAGVRGLAGMGAMRSMGDDAPVILRPLLAVSRAEVEAYAQQQGLAFVEDESNQDVRFTRNFLRQDWLPQLDARFPSWRKQVVDAQENLRECAELLDEVARQDADLAICAAGVRIDALASMSRPRAQNLLRYWLARLGVNMPGRIRLAELLEQMLNSAADAQPVWHIDGVRLGRHQGLLVRMPTLDPPGLEATTWRWQGEAVLDLGALGQLQFTRGLGEGIAERALQSAWVQVRTRSGGEQLQLDAARPRRTLKNLLREAAIPVWQREMLPLVFVGEALAWVPGIGVDHRFQAHAGEPGFVISWRPPRL